MANRPKRMKVLVMGSGVIGVTTAYYLARDGHEVTVLDRWPRPACEASYANAGLVAPGHAYAWASPKAPKILLKSLYRNDQALRLRLRADPRMWSWLVLFLRNCTAERARVNTIRKLGLCLYSLDALHEVSRETGVQYDGRSGGVLYLYRTRQSFDQGVANTGILRDNGLTLDVLARGQLAQMDPSLAPVQDKIAGAIHSPADESGDASMFSRALAQVCGEKLGVIFALDTTIRDIGAGAGRVERVLTDKGDFEADAYVLCLGCDSPILARKIGIRLPIYPVKGYSVTIPVGGRRRAPRLGSVDEDNLVAFARMGDRLRITATAEISGYDRGHSPADFKTMLKVARDLFPEGGDYNHPDYWAGLRPMTPGGAPIFGRAGYSNLFLNTGHGHIGWTMACGSAKITADLLAGRQPGISLQGMTLEQEAT